MLIDSHCHLDFPALAGRLPEVMAKAEAAGVVAMLTISTRVKRVAECRAIAESWPGIFFTVGTHPHNAAEEPDVGVDEILRHAQHPRCVAIGEAGLDFHYDCAPRAIQERVFRTHIEAARTSGLPLVIHARDADEAMIAILQDEHGRGRFDAVLHCFSSGERLAAAGVELGFYVSFSGILTFKRSTELRRIATAIVPPDRLLVETDAPYLAPEPHRGAVNEPAYVALTARVLADAIGVSPERLGEMTTANFARLFAKAELAGRAHAGSFAA